MCFACLIDKFPKFQGMPQNTTIPEHYQDCISGVMVSVLVMSAVDL
jgi:hypothetical protein